MTWVAVFSAKYSSTRAASSSRSSAVSVEITTALHGASASR
nr:hypothetical protein [Saccharopolyspora karakumensis]